MCNIISYKLQDLQIEKNNKGKKKVLNNNNDNDNTKSLTIKRRKTSEKEKKKLEKIFCYHLFSKNKVFDILKQLQEKSIKWDIEYIKTY